MEHTNEHLYFLNSLYRDFILPTILGSEDKEILYWPENMLVVNMIYQISMI